MFHDHQKKYRWLGAARRVLALSLLTAVSTPMDARSGPIARWLGARIAARRAGFGGPFPMRKEYDFSKGKRGPIVPLPPGKTQVLVHVDTEILEWLRDQAD